MMEENNIFYGFVPSQLDGTEVRITEDTYKSLSLPKAYSYLDYMSPVLNQGSDSTCVPHALSAIYDYYYNVKNPDKNDGQFISSNIAIYQIYNSRPNNGPGMTYKHALEYCKNTGVVNKDDFKSKNFDNATKITEYALLGSMEVMKRSLIVNGPCLVATMVRDQDAPDFWNGRKNFGGHATSIIGYDDNKGGFILRNSWGTGFGSNGYVLFPYRDFHKIMEAWAVIM